LDLSEEKKDSLKQEGFDRRSRRPKLSLEAAHVNTSKEQEIPEPMRPKPNLQTVHISQAIEKQKTPDLESATPESYQEITDTIVHSRNRFLVGYADRAQSKAGFRAKSDIEVEVTL
jgi:hypothetical protein